jgi:hypothetical protein
MGKPFTVARIDAIEVKLLERSMEAASTGDFEKGNRYVDRFYRVYNREPYSTTSDEPRRKLVEQLEKARADLEEAKSFHSTAAWRLISHREETVSELERLLKVYDEAA